MVQFKVGGQVTEISNPNKVWVIDSLDEESAECSSGTEKKTFLKSKIKRKIPLPLFGKNPPSKNSY